MSSFENNPLINKKHPDLPGSKEVERAVKVARSEGEAVPDRKDTRIGAYFKRLDRIAGDERGVELLKHKIEKEFIVDLEDGEGKEDEEKITKLATGLFESEKKIARERGQGTGSDVLSAPQREVYRKAIYEKQSEQKQTLNTWLEYLGSKDTDYMPVWFKYYALRSLEKLGTRNKETAEYTRRTGTTLHPFPELDREALSLVLDQITKQQKEDASNEVIIDKTEEQKELERIVTREDFGKIYASFQGKVEAARLENREGIEGEWVKYEQGTDSDPLYKSLEGKGTGWCTAGSETAKNQLAEGDFYVYYTLNSGNEYSNPRIAIRMENDEVAEVRGIGKDQELEPLLVDTAREQYKDLPGGDKYEKKATDMKRLTAIETKQSKREVLTKDDLMFLYETDAAIEGFGYKADPRIAELRSERNMQEDLATLLDCEIKDIANSTEELTESTKFLIGEFYTFDLSALSYNELKKVVKFPDLQLVNTESMRVITFKKVVPQAIDYEALSATGASKSNEIYVNPEAFAVDWETVSMNKIKMLTLPEFVGKTRLEVATFIAKEYGENYVLPDISYQQFLMNNPDKVPPSMMDGKWYSFYGSVSHTSLGGTYVPLASWQDGKLESADSSLGDIWNINSSIVLLEK